MSEPYATATVVGRAPPVSAHLGDRAVVYADGRMEGFVGGACSREIVRAQALRSLRTGESRLVRIRPDAQVVNEDLDSVTVPMMCASEGGVDVFIEPQLSKPRLIVAGDTPVTEALGVLGPFLGYEPVIFKTPAQFDDFVPFADALHADESARSVALAASQGHFDERALTEFLAYDFGFTGLLASRKRGERVIADLSTRGTGPERLERVRYPAGLAIGARRPADVAVSIFAEIIATFARTAPATQSEAVSNGALAIDPVCGMEIAVATASYSAQENGETRYFCSAHCLGTFVPA